MNRELPLPSTPGAETLREILSSPSRYIGVNILVALTAMIVLVLGFQVAFAGRIFPGVRAMGADLGGKTPQEAQQTLDSLMDDFGARSITMQFDKLAWSRTGSELGLRRETQPIVAAAFDLGRDGNPMLRIITQITLWRTGRNLDANALLYEPATMRGALEDIATQINRPVIDAHLKIQSDGAIDYQASAIGRELDIDGSARKLVDALGHSGPQSVELAVNQVAPRVSDEMISSARDQANLLLGSPLTLRFRNQQWQLNSAAIAKTLKILTPENGSISIDLDKAGLEKIVEQIAAEIDQEPLDARFAWAGGNLDVIRDSKDGQKLDRPATVDLLNKQLLGPERTLSLPVSVSPAAVRAEDRAKLGITSLIDSNKTNFSSGLPPKKHNIQLAASRLNGVVVPPGGMFSFNKEVGSTSLDAGYQVGWGIAASGNAGGHKTVPSVAGGICQVATTLFQTVFWSGYQIEERNWHLYWIPSYTSRGIVGLDATVDEDSGLDFKFVNTTNDSILIQSWIDASLNVNFALYGTPPPWKVKIEALPKTEVVDPEPGTLIEEEPTLPKGQRIAVEGAQAGFTSTVVRTVTSNEGEDRTLRMSSRYRPARNVIMVGTGGAPPSAPRTEGGENRAQVSSGAQAQPTVRPGQTPAQATAVPTKPAAATAAATSAPKPTAPAVVQPTAAPAKPTVAAQPTTAPKPTSAPATATRR